MMDSDYLLVKIMDEPVFILSFISLCCRKRAIVKHCLLLDLNVIMGLPLDWFRKLHDPLLSRHTKVTRGLDQGTSRSSFVFQTRNQFYCTSIWIGPRRFAITIFLVFSTLGFYLDCLLEVHLWLPFYGICRCEDFPCVCRGLPHYICLVWETFGQMDFRSASAAQIVELWGACFCSFSGWLPTFCPVKGRKMGSICLLLWPNFSYCCRAVHCTMGSMLLCIFAHCDEKRIACFCSLYRFPRQYKEGGQRLLPLSETAGEDLAKFCFGTPW